LHRGYGQDFARIEKYRPHCLRDCRADGVTRAALALDDFRAALLCPLEYPVLEIEIEVFKPLHRQPVD
jgi:hypothetical protein